MKIPLEWENILEKSDESEEFGIIIYRFKVLGGWIMTQMICFEDRNVHLTSTFVPDSDHIWEVK